MSKLIDFKNREEITRDPEYTRLYFDLPNNKYSEEDIDKIIKFVDSVLTGSKIFHTTPEAMSIYEEIDYMPGDPGIG